MSTTSAWSINNSLSTLCSRAFRLFALATFALTGCQKKEGGAQRKAELRLNLSVDPPSLDPRRATDTTSRAVINMCFEGLTRLDKDGIPTPAAAERIEISEDGKTYTFF